MFLRVPYLSLCRQWFSTRRVPRRSILPCSLGRQKTASLARPPPRLFALLREIDRRSSCIACSDLRRAWSAPARRNVQLVRTSPKRLALGGSACKPTTSRSTRHGRALYRLECVGDALRLFTPAGAAVDPCEKPPRGSGNGSLSPQPAVPRLNPPEYAAAGCGERHPWRRSVPDHNFQLK
jgi:hypothetical protein